MRGLVESVDLAASTVTVREGHGTLATVMLPSECIEELSKSLASQPPKALSLNLDTAAAACFLTLHKQTSESYWAKVDVICNIDENDWREERGMSTMPDPNLLREAARLAEALCVENNLPLPTVSGGWDDDFDVEFEWGEFFSTPAHNSRRLIHADVMLDTMSTEVYFLDLDVEQTAEEYAHATLNMKSREDRRELANIVRTNALTVFDYDYKEFEWPS